MTDRVKYILRCITFSCIVILFEVGYHVVVKQLQTALDYILHGIIFCVALMALDYVVNLWKDYRANKAEK